MLKSLQIRNLAVIAELELDFGPGFNVLSGETGAGKSILFTALGLLLGDRAEGGLVRGEASRAEISAEFTVAADSAAARWLAAEELADPDVPESLLLRRLLPLDGQSRAFVNGAPVTLRQLKALAECLVDIHGQHAHQQLLQAGRQRQLLDDFGGLQAPLHELAACHARLSEIDREISALGTPGEAAEQRGELLRYQLEELEALAPEPEEFAALAAEFRRLEAVDRLLGLAGEASRLLYGDADSLYERSDTALAALRDCAEIDPQFEEALLACEQAQVSLKEAGQAAADAAESIEPDPARLTEVSQRLDRYQELARKHRCAPVDLAAHWQRLAEELQRLDHAGEALTRLEAERRERRADYDRRSLALSAARAEAGEALAAQVESTLRPLGLAHAQCRVAVRHRADQARSAAGQDQVEFLISANPGQDPAPLAKVASGGELARTSLAIQVVCLDQAPVPVLLFDEVDVGVGGGIAEVVGRRLQELGERYQVFCVTHQPQVAALAHRHFAVRKEVAAGQTFTLVQRLDRAGRIEELARMLGGLTITRQTRAHAEEMLAVGD